MKINISDIIGKPSLDYIEFMSGEVKSIQTPYEYLLKVKEVVHKECFILEHSMPVHKRLSLEAHIKFMVKWYNKPLKVDDILKQYQIEGEKKIPLVRLSSSMNQRLSYIHAMITDQSCVLAIDPFYNATNDNIHLFHKMMAQIKKEGKSLIVITSRTEDAFLVQPNIMKLNDTGLHEVEVSEDRVDEQNTDIKKIKVKAEDKTIFVSLEEIEYIESNEGKVYINISREKFVMESTLQEAESKLKQYGFYRCHRSYIINLHKVKEIITWSKNTYSVVINNRDGTKVPLSRQKYNEIQELLVTL
jgi:ABC-2 type transport system ATP-binding protein